VSAPRQVRGCCRIDELSPAELARVHANRTAANKKKREAAAISIDWTAAIERLKAMLSEMYGDE